MQFLVWLQLDKQATFRKHSFRSLRINNVKFAREETMKNISRIYHIAIAEHTLLSSASKNKADHTRRHRIWKAKLKQLILAAKRKRKTSGHWEPYPEEIVLRSLRINNLIPAYKRTRKHTSRRNRIAIAEDQSLISRLQTKTPRIEYVPYVWHGVASRKQKQCRITENHAIHWARLGAQSVRENVGFCFKNVLYKIKPHWEDIMLRSPRMDDLISVAKGQRSFRDEIISWLPRINNLILARKLPRTNTTEKEHIDLPADSEGRQRREATILWSFRINMLIPSRKRRGRPFGEDTILRSRRINNLMSEYTKPFRNEIVLRSTRNIYSSLVWKKQRKIRIAKQSVARERKGRPWRGVHLLSLLRLDHLKTARRRTRKTTSRRDQLDR